MLARPPLAERTFGSYQDRPNAERRSRADIVDKLAQLEAQNRSLSARLTGPATASPSYGGRRCRKTTGEPLV
jgi:hypothetical protein